MHRQIAVSFLYSSDTGQYKKYMESYSPLKSGGGIFSFFMTSCSVIIDTHKQFWGSMVKETWGRLTLMEKIIWFFFLNQTIAIITIIEIILLKKG